jgi:hypothetical protein
MQNVGWEIVTWIVLMGFGILLMKWAHDWEMKKRDKAYQDIRKSIEQEDSPEHIKKSRLDFLDMAYITGAKIYSSKKGKGVRL